jgi:hypothetical protein
MVQTSKGEVLIETTDRFGGFVTGGDAIEKRAESYRKNMIATNAPDHSLQYSFNLYQYIPSKNLNGLLYFNQAVKAYNRRDLLESSSLLEKANSNYSSPRCEEFGIVLTRTVMQSPLDDDAKSACLAHLSHILVRKEVAGLD